MKQAEKLWIFLFLFLIALTISCSAWPGRAVPSGYLFIHFINVGYGDSIFVEFPAGGNMLIDGGNREAGVRVADYLKERKIKKLDLVVVTHPHPDHLEGLFSVAQKYKIDSIIANEDIPESKNYTPFFEVVKGKGIEFKQVKRGEIIKRFKKVEIEILHPDKLTGNWNNDSLAMKLTYKKVSFLLVADLGQKTCDELAKHYQERLKSTVLKVPHHGKGGGGEFIRKASPEVAVLCVGPSIWGGPSEEILAEYKDSKIPLLRTDEKGTIVIKTDGEKIWL